MSRPYQTSQRVSHSPFIPPCVRLALASCVTSEAREATLDRATLAALFDAGGEIAFVDLWRRLPCTRRELWRSLDRQYRHGNVRRHVSGEPISLTPAARIAIAAGRDAAAAGGAL